MKIVKTDNTEKIKDLTSESSYITNPASNKEEREFYLLKDNDSVIGCGYVRTFLKKMGNMGSVFIVKDRRGEGLGSYLVKELENVLKEKGVWIIIIGVHNDNKKGLQFWQEKGYTIFLDSANEPINEMPLDVDILNKISPVPFPDKNVSILYKKLMDFDLARERPLDIDNLTEELEEALDW